MNKTGKFRWVICGLLFALVALSYIDRLIIGMLKKPIGEQLGWSEVDYGNIAAGFSFAYAFGYLFAGNTSTGAMGIKTTRGHVYTGGVSVLHDFTSRLTLGIEAYGGLSSSDVLGRSQLQFLAGGQYAVRNGLAVTFGILGGKYIASPRIGGQIGLSVDFPDVFGRGSERDTN